MKLTAAQKRYTDDFEKKLRFRPVVIAEKFVDFYRLPLPLTNVELGAHEQEGKAHACRCPETHGRL